MTNLYEKWKLYKANPCDYDAFCVLQPVGRVLARLTTRCPCCNGARILAAGLFGAMFGYWVLVPLALVAGLSVLAGEDDDGEQHH